MKKRFLAAILAATLIVLLCASCSLFGGNDAQTTSSDTSSTSEEPPGPPPDFPVTVRDVEIGAKPTRIVSLSPMLTELLYDLGAQATLVGISDYCNYPLDVTTLPQVGTAIAPLVDDIIALAPDLILTLAPLQTAVADTLAGAGIAVLVLGQAADADGLVALYGELGRALYGVSDESGAKKGHEWKTALDKVGETVRAALSSIGRSPYKALYITTDAPNFATADSFEASVLALVGIDVATGDATGYVLDDDAVKACNADIIIDGAGLGADVIKAGDLYKRLPAVSQNKLYEIDQAIVDCRGMRLPVILKGLVEEVYPAAFS